MIQDEMVGWHTNSMDMSLSLTGFTNVKHLARLRGSVCSSQRLTGSPGNAARMPAEQMNVETDLQWP